MAFSAKTKDEWRAALVHGAAVDGVPQAEWGRLAQRLRGLASYRAAKRVFVGPSAVLSQIRINVLLDGKELLMPSPGLREGFYLCRPYVIPFADLSYATTYHGLPKFGRLVGEKSLAAVNVGVLVTDLLAVDPQGMRLGDGQGFFDLACALLSELGGLARAQSVVVGVAADEQQVDELLPAEPWDVALDEVITPSGERTFFHQEAQLPAICWPQLAPERIRRLTPLWKLAQKRGD